MEVVRTARNVLEAPKDIGADAVQQVQQQMELGHRQRGRLWRSAKDTARFCIGAGMWQKRGGWLALERDTRLHERGPERPTLRASPS